MARASAAGQTGAERATRPVDEKLAASPSAEPQPVCEKPFAPETARGGDEDEPCRDGEG